MRKVHVPLATAPATRDRDARRAHVSRRIDQVQVDIVVPVGGLGPPQGAVEGVGGRAVNAERDVDGLSGADRDLAPPRPPVSGELERAGAAGVVGWIWLLPGEDQLRVHLPRVDAEAAAAEPVAQQGGSARAVRGGATRATEDLRRGVGGVARRHRVSGRLDVGLEAAVAGRPAAFAYHLRERRHVEVADANHAARVGRRVNGAGARTVVSVGGDHDRAGVERGVSRGGYGPVVITAGLHLGDNYPVERRYCRLEAAQHRALVEAATGVRINLPAIEGDRGHATGTIAEVVVARDDRCGRGAMVPAIVVRVERPPTVAVAAAVDAIAPIVDMGWAGEQRVAEARTRVEEPDPATGLAEVEVGVTHDVAPAGSDVVGRR